jgi:hypothetical protein
MRYLTLILLALSLTIAVPAFALVDLGEEVATTVDDDDSAAPEAPAGDDDSAANDDAVPAVDDDDSAVVAVPTTDEEAILLISKLLDAANNGHWTVFAGLLILLLVFGMNRLGLAAKIGGKWVPWVTLGTGAAVAIAIGLATGAPVGESIAAGLLEGTVAIALWELLARHVTTKKADGTDRA